MKFAYPQDPTRSVSAMRRLDEASDAATQQSNLERQQGLATVGETVPLLFCHRHDFGFEQGINGGVWVSPRLIQLGIEQTSLSMMYLLSQGLVTGLNIEHVHWGYPKLQSVDPDAQFCAAYEEVPDCIDLDYDPGGSLSWTTTVTTSGTSGQGSFVTEDNCTKIAITFDAAIQVSGSGQIAGGYGGERALLVESSGRVRGQFTGSGLWSTSISGYDSGTEQKLVDSRTETRRESWGSSSSKYYYSFTAKHVQASWTQTSEVRYDYAVYKNSDNALITSGQVWVRNGSTSLTIDSLNPDTYRVVFNNEYKQRNKSYSTTTYTEPAPTSSAWSSEWFKRVTSPPRSGFYRHTNPGSETQNIASTVVQTITNTLEFPDLPGGEQQLVGGLSDLTMVGISGDITKLRPVSGPDYFTQLHVFVENGIQVDRLLDDTAGPSGLYPDLVNYLMESTQILQSDQIDKDSLIAAARMNQQYAMYYNGLLQTTNSLAEWMTRTAPYFLLSPRQVNGRYGLAPVTPLDSNYELSREPITPALVIGQDEIVQGSYRRTYISNKDRRPICLVMVYKDQPQEAVGQTVTVEIRYPGSALSGPFEQHDLTEFCCRSEHCIYAARYILAKRRYTTHTCSLAVNRKGKAINPGDIIRVDLNLQTSDGAGIVDQVMYQVESVSEGQMGSVLLELIHFPVDEFGVSMIAKEVHAGEISIS